MKADAPSPKIVTGLHSTSAAQPVDFALKETRPYLGDGAVVAGRILHHDKRASAYGLVERMDFLYVSVVKARDLPILVDIPGSLDPFVEVRVGNYKGVTKHIDMSQDPEWNVVFAFSKDRMQASVLDVAVKYKDLEDDYIVRFGLNEVPRRVPSDGPLAPQWYPLEDNTRERIEGELMLAVWTGTQADEAFHNAWHFDAAVPIIDLSASTCTQFRPKVYLVPKLWYVRVTVIEAQELEPTDRTCFPEVHVKVRIGDQVMRTKALQSRTLSSVWNEDLLFVVAEPFDEDLLVLTVENYVSPDKVEIIGSVNIPLNNVDRRADNQPTPARWYNLKKTTAYQLKKENFCSRLHLRLCLDGGYNVLDDTARSSDVQPSAEELCKTSIGVLELGIRKAEQLHPMKTRHGRETSDTYCIAKYGKKWVRSRTIVDSLCPKYHEVYSWEVFDTSTVLTVGVFDNRQFGGEGENGNKDLGIGKVRIRISTLEMGRTYSQSYPLLVLYSSGVKLMGKLHLAIRFSCTSFANMLYQYSRPILPKMHYIQPLGSSEKLRHEAATIVATRFGRAEPALCKEAVEYMYGVDSAVWSMRKSKANFFRLMGVFSGLIAMLRWFGGVCSWKNPITTLLVQILFLTFVCYPMLILRFFFLYAFLISAWNYRYRPRYTSHTDTKISCAETRNSFLDELDEELDSSPASWSEEQVRMRYKRLRNVAGRIQMVAGDFATLGERFLLLLTWKDPFATAIFGIFCLITAVVLYVMPFQVVVALAGMYLMRHPRFRSPLPSLPINFYRRLPDKIENML